MHSLRVHLFGKFSIEATAAPLAGFESAKAQELFCYLLCHRNQPQARENLAELLWCNSSPSQSKKYLRQALWQLQQVINAVCKLDRNAMIQAEHDCVTLRALDYLWLDVAEYETAFATCARVRGRALTAPQAEALRHAVELYRGDLLEGCYQDWCLCERERLKNIYLNILNKLLAYHEAHDDWENGLLIGERLLSVDSLSEQTHQKMMRLFYLSGNRTAALRQYVRCQQVLKEELSVQPSKSTVALYEQIRNDRLQPETLGQSPAPAARPAATDPLPEVLNRLQQLHSVLADLQRTVHEEIQTVEEALRQRHPALR